MHKDRSGGIVIITVIACVIALMMDSLSDADLSHIALVTVSFGILIMLGMIYEELKL